MKVSLAREFTVKVREIAYLCGVVQRPSYPAAFDERRAIFIHIPKAAGMSVALTLFEREVGHFRIRDLQSMDRRKTREYFKFSFVRNPWDRLVSAFFFLQKGGLAHHAKDQRFRDEVLSRYGDFDEFVCGWLKPDNLHRQIHFYPQSEFICDWKGRIAVDVLGRYENLDDDYRQVTERLGMPRELPRHNPSQHSDYREYYTSRTRQIVADVYRNDVSLLDYAFD